MRSRAGYTLMGTLTVVMLLGVFMTGFLAVFRNTVPRLATLREQIRATDVRRDLLKTLRRDLSTATGLPDRAADRRANETTLLVASDETTKVYRIVDDTVERRTLDAEGRPVGEPVRSWELGRAVVQWKVIDRGQPGEAVEVRTGLRRPAVEHPASRGLDRPASGRLTWVLPVGGEVER